MAIVCRILMFLQISLLLIQVIGGPESSASVDAARAFDVVCMRSQGAPMWGGVNAKTFSGMLRQILAQHALEEIPSARVCIEQERSLSPAQKDFSKSKKIKHTLTVDLTSHPLELEYRVSLESALSQVSPPERLEEDTSHWTALSGIEIHLPRLSSPYRCFASFVDPWHSSEWAIFPVLMRTSPHWIRTSECVENIERFNGDWTRRRTAIRGALQLVAMIRDLRTQWREYVGHGLTPEVIESSQISLQAFKNELSKYAKKQRI
jgi:hypothetical protein